MLCTRTKHIVYHYGPATFAAILAREHEKTYKPSKKALLTLMWMAIVSNGGSIFDVPRGSGLLEQETTI